MKHSEIPARNRAIRARYAEGHPAARIAVEFHMTVRHIHMIVSPGDRQPGRPAGVRLYKPVGIGWPEHLGD